jgi:hypothetical protein
MAITVSGLRLRHILRLPGWRRRSTVSGLASHGEMLKLVDRESRRNLGMSGAEFRKALERGELPDSPAVAHLSILAGTHRR